MIINNSESTDFTEKMQRCQSHIEALEAERRKIQVFERELPLCLELVTQAIEGWRQQMSGTTPDYFNGGQSDCSEHTSSEAPVLEEFVFLKRTSSINDQLDEQHSRKDKIFSTSNQSNDVCSDKFSKKSDWLRSVQLSIQTTPDPTTTKEDSPRKVSVVEVKKNGGGAFHPFKKEKGCGTAVVSTRRPSPPGDPAAAASSTAEMGGSSGGGGGGGCGGVGSKREDKDEQSNRKARRCWSPELHKRFLHSLQQLGGAHVATPKQIRELMKVDGLTNDEVKSHLQKYRLHTTTRRPSPSIHNSNNGQTPQFVVVGGLWMPPAEYASMTITTTSGGAATPNGIYAPIASLPSIGEAANKRQRSENFHSEERGCSHSEDRTRSNSPTTTSSSTHTTTASPAF